LNSPIAVTSGLQDKAVQAEITQQANLLALLALAQSEGQIGHTLEALEYYLKAAELAPDSDLLQFFIGREYLFTIKRKPIPPAADPAFEQKALEALEKALQLNPHNARAYVGLGGAYVDQAQPLVEGAVSAGLTDENFGKVMQFLDQADTAYGRVLQPEFDTAEYGVPVQDIARLGLGDARLLRGVALQENGQTELAGMTIRQAIQMLDQTLPDFRARELSRYLAQNYQFLGSAYQWSGYLSQLAGDYPTAIQAYQQANKQLNACVGMSKSSSDRIIKSDIVENYCQPMLQQTEQRLKVLEAGS
jgi:tetratricopeptide (TPR) repeat protein